MTCDELHTKYGPFKEIWRDRETELLKQGKWRHILAIISTDNDDAPLCASVGHHLVNVDVILESTKKLPEDLMVDDFWFTE